MNQSTSAKNPPLKIQISLGIAFAFLNLLLHFLNNFNPVPLYADTLFTLSATFLGLTSGLICAVLSHILFFAGLSFWSRIAFLDDLQSFHCCYNSPLS